MTAAVANPVIDLFCREAQASIARRKAELVPQRLVDFLAWLGVPPSPVVAAICDASEAREIQLGREICEEVFGCLPDYLPKMPPRTVVVRAGGRGGKTSRLLAPKAIHAALTVPLPTLRKGEHAWSLIIAPDKSLAMQALNFARGYIAERPELAKRVVNTAKGAADGEVGTTECITLRRDDGHLVDLRIGAATRGGKAARGKTLVFVGLDEAAFFYSDDGYTVTDAEIYRAAIQRLVPGAQLWVVSTPWIEGYGVMEERIAADWGKHEHSLVAVGGTRALNPTWDPDGTIEADMRANDPDNAAREIDAIPLPAGTKFFFDPELIKQRLAENDNNLEPIRDIDHYAGSDLGFRKNSSALAIVRKEENVVHVAFRQELRPAPKERLKPSKVCEGFAEAALRYGCRSIMGDIHYADTADEVMPTVKGDRGRTLFYEEVSLPANFVSQVMTKLRKLLTEGHMLLPNDRRLLLQMRKTTTKPVPGGAEKVILPHAKDGSHGDLLMALALAVWQVPTEPAKEERKTRTKGRRSVGASTGGF